MKRLVQFCALLLCLSVPLAANAAGDAERGAAAYASDCASCHGDAAAIAASVKGSTDEETGAKLESFLTRHFAPDADTRADIIAHLIALSS